MSQHPFAADQYLETMVQTASPARLRLLLICKAVHLCEEILGQPHSAVPSDKALHLREILGELLSGVGKESGELGRQISDIYVFLLRHLTLAEQTGNQQLIQEMRGVLRIEQDTWEQACAAAMAPLAPPVANYETHAGAGFSLEM